MDVVVDCIRYLKRIREMSGHQKRQCITDALLLLLDETNSGELEFTNLSLNQWFLLL